MKTFPISKDIHSSTYNYACIVHDDAFGDWDKLKIKKKNESYYEYTLTKRDCAWLIDTLEKAKKRNSDERLDQALNVWRDVEAELWTKWSTQPDNPPVKF